MNSSRINGQSASIGNAGYGNSPDRPASVKPQEESITGNQILTDDLNDVRIPQKKTPDWKLSAKQTGNAATEMQVSAERQTPKKPAPKKSFVPTVLDMDQGAAGAHLLEGKNADKRAIIDSLTESTMSAKKKEKIFQRLSKYPDGALRLIKDNNVKILDKPLDFLWNPGGLTTWERTETSASASKPASTSTAMTIEMKKGALLDVFIDHPLLSSLFAGKRSLVLGNGLLAAIMLSSALTAPVSTPVLTLALLADFSAVLIGQLRNNSAIDPLEHETAHALDYSLGASGKYRDMPLDNRVNCKNRDSLKKDEIPFSYKSRELLDCFINCQEGKNGSQFITDYADRDPMEYFAESVKAYLNTERSGSDVCSKDLQEKDPQIYLLIDNLFKELQ